MMSIQVKPEGLLHYGFQGHVVLGGNAAAIFVLGRKVRNRIIKAPELDADLPPGSLHRFEATREAKALIFAHANAQRGGLGKQQAREAVGVSGMAQHGQQQARTPLLHLHGRGKNVERSGSQRAVEDIGEDLRRQVVEVRLDDSDRL
jgi:hypothetical protein